MQALDSLTERLRELEALQYTVGKAHGLVLRGIGDARLSLSPIESLPNELLRQVLQFVGPDEYETIRILASVCVRWKDTVHGERRLST